jgi:hypothetical protein
MSGYSQIWIDDLSLDRYRPMLRLLASGDIEFLRRTPGCTPRLVRSLRAKRSRILREYLQSLSEDFHRVLRASRVQLAQSPDDRPALALELLRREWRFNRGMAAVRIRLALYGWGLAEVDPTPLVWLFEAARIRLHDLAPSAA